MNIIRDGVMLIVYTFSIILAFIFLSGPTATMITSIMSAGDAPQMHALETELLAVFGISTALAVLIPTIVFIWLAFSDPRMEIQY